MLVGGPDYYVIEPGSGKEFDLVGKSSERKTVLREKLVDAVR